MRNLFAVSMLFLAGIAVGQQNEDQGDTDKEESVASDDPSAETKQPQGFSARKSRSGYAEQPPHDWSQFPIQFWWVEIIRAVPPILKKMDPTGCIFLGGAASQWQTLRR